MRALIVFVPQVLWFLSFCFGFFAEKYEKKSAFYFTIIKKIIIIEIFLEQM